MKKKRKIGMLLIVTSLILALLPVPEADAATSASDFMIQSGVLKKYKGTEKNVTIPDSVEIIGEGAFQENLNIETVTLPASVKKIEAYAFWGCDNLRTVTLGKGLQEVGDLAFNNCTGLRSIEIPKNIRRIGIQSFAYCKNLEFITIPPEVTEIRDDAFEGDYLLNIHCEVGSYADRYAQDFYERQKEMPVYAQEQTDPVQKPSNSGSDTSADPYPEASADLLGSTYVVGNQAVLLMQSAGLDVKDGAPGGNAGSVADTENAADDPLKENTAERIGERAFYRNDRLGEEMLPGSILEIGQFAYARSSLTKIMFPQGLQKIGYAAFYHCDDLTDVAIPDTVNEVGPKAFARTAWVDHFLNDKTDEAAREPYLISGGVLVAYRGNAAEITVPEGVRVIAGEAFADHAELTKVTLPASLVSIGEKAFLGCGLEALTYMGTAFGTEVLQEQVRISELSAPPIEKSGFQWNWGAAGVLFLVGLSFMLMRRRVY